MKISLVIAYTNRLKHLYHTLESLMLTSFPRKDIELVIVDDSTLEAHVITPAILQSFDFQKVLLRVDPLKKNWTNPAINFNIGFQNCSGDTLCYCNPEALLVGDAISYIANNIKPNKYISFSCWSASPETTNNLYSLPNFKKETIDDCIGIYGTQDNSQTSFNVYYNHPTIRPVAYHWFAAMTREDMVDLGGFDSRYANGVGYDDDEIVHRIKMKGMEIDIPTDPKVIHCYHSPVNYNAPPNYQLYHEFTKNRKSYKALES